MAANTEKSVSLTDSDVQTFLKEKENQYAKRKAESYVFSGFNNSISRGWERKSATGRFAMGRSDHLPLPVGKDEVDEWEFCKLKIKSITVFVFINQYILPSCASASTYCAILIRKLSISSFFIR